MARVFALGLLIGYRTLTSLILLPQCVKGSDDEEKGTDDAVTIFQLVAGTRQEAGDPLWINYGSSKGNGDLLVHHGLCIPHNPADRCTFSPSGLSSPGPSFIANSSEL